MKMKGLVLVIFILACFTAYPQAVISFDQDSHDFGNIKEINGVVSYNFVFTNTGNAPILVKNVESSCGCTSPEWSKQPVLPGKTGYVKATFDPKDRPGYFDKTISVFSNAKTSVVELKIKGTVEGKARTILDEYPYEQPSGLRLPLDHISLMKARKGEMKNMSIGVYNNAGKKVSVSFMNVPAYIKIAMEPQQLDMKQVGTINVSYNTAVKGDFGLNKENITLVVDGKKYPLPVSVFVEEDFSGVNQASAPDIAADKKYYNFGSITPTAQATYSYKITNTGKSPLKIHRVYTNDDRLTVEGSKSDLQSGESVMIAVKTVKGAAKGKVTGLISVISNSPVNPELNLRFYGEIK